MNIASYIEAYTQATQANGTPLISAAGLLAILLMCAGVVLMMVKGKKKNALGRASGILGALLGIAFVCVSCFLNANINAVTQDFQAAVLDQYDLVLDDIQANDLIGSGEEHREFEFPSGNMNVFVDKNGHIVTFTNTITDTEILPKGTDAQELSE